MQGSIPSEKMNPQVSAYDGKRGGWCDDGKMKAAARKTDNSKPRNKRDYTSQRKLKEKFLVFSS
jgi:hypothetical protein